MITTTPQTDLPELEKYEVLGKIADGSMASVYKARRREDDTLVAVKIPSPAVTRQATLFERFQKEYRAGNSLCHPNIVRALDFGQEGPTVYLVMEFVDGPDLWQRIEQSGRLPEKEAVGIIAQVGEGLQEAHKHGIIHRDVKPDNILLAPDGRAKLADLGLIKDLEDSDALTRSRKGLGTPNFIAPEQFSDARHAGVRCDVYALAATLYMAVTGELPFRGRSLAATLRLKLNNELTPARQLVPGLSEKVDWAIRRALQVEPERRQASCGEFIQALTGEGPVAPWSPVERPAASPATKRPARERRRAVRYACHLSTFCELLTSIHDGEAAAHDSWPVTVRDLSVGGIKFAINRRFEAGTVIVVQLKAPDRSFQRSAEMRVIRVTPVRGGQWLIGGAFSEPLGKEELRKLL
jgi:serine/threonine protein kinase